VRFLRGIFDALLALALLRLLESCSFRLPLPYAGVHRTGLAFKIRMADRTAEKCTTIVMPRTLAYRTLPVKQREFSLAKVGVEGSNPFARSKKPKKCRHLVSGTSPAFSGHIGEAAGDRLPAPRQFFRSRNSVSVYGSRSVCPRSSITNPGCRLRAQVRELHLRAEEKPQQIRYTALRFVRWRKKHGLK
jgi:hypothetical protein